MSKTAPDPYPDDPDFEGKDLPERHYGSRRDEAARRRAVVKKMAKRYENRATIPHGDRYDEPERQEDPLGEVPRQEDPVKVFRPGSYEEGSEPASAARPDTRRPAVRDPRTERKERRTEKQNARSAQRSKAREAKKGALDVKIQALPRRTFVFAVAACAVVLVAAIVVVVSIVRTNAFAALEQSATSDTTAAASGISTFVDQVEGNDLDGATKTAAKIDSHISSLEQTVASDDWKNGSEATVEAGKTAAKQLRAAYDGLVSPVLAVGKEQDTFDLIGDDNTVNTALAISLTDAFASAETTVDDLSGSIDDLADSDADGFADAAKEAQRSLSHIKSATSLATTLQPSLGGLLGANGSRSYLVVVQDPAQWRSTGGYPRSMGVLTVSNGAFSLSDLQAVDTAFSFLYYGIRIDGTDEETSLFGSDFTKRMNTLLTVPDVPRAAQAVMQSYENYTGTDVSGVIFVDPTAFAGMLKLSGSATLEDGTVVDENNVASYLGSELPSSVGSWEFDGYYTSAATGVLTAFLENLGSYGFGDLADFAYEEASAGHLLAWSENETEEALFAHFGADGAISRDPATPELGVFLNDASEGSIDWYLTAKTEVSDPTTAEDGSVTYTVTTTISNALTSEQAKNIRSNNWSSPALGTSSQKQEASDAIVDVYLFAPAGGSISDLAVTSTSGATGSDSSASSSSSAADASSSDTTDSSSTAADWSQREGSWEGLSVIADTVHAIGGETVTFTYTVTCAAGSATLAVQQTPNAQAA